MRDSIGAESVGCAGYREQENLIQGRHVYVGDVVVASAHRRGKLGAKSPGYVCDAA